MVPSPLPFCVLAAVVTVTVGQDFSPSCLIELSAISGAGTAITETTCRALGNYELCVATLEPGTLRTAAQSQLSSFQATLQGCVDRAPGRPRITTRDNGVVFDGNSFTFARSRRDVVDLHELRDTIVGYEAQLSSMSSMVAGYEDDRSQLVSMLVATASEQSVTDVGARVTALEASDGGCIPFVEFVRGSTCVPLSPPCRSTQYEAAHPTRTSDRVCRTPTACSSAQFETAPAESMYDRTCASLTVCNDTAYESVAPTATSDRTCIAAPPECRSGMSNGLMTLSTNGVQRTEYCFSDGSTAGGDGSARANAGKSCYTIRHGHAVTDDGARWVYENNPDSPFQVFCDMANCGGDTTNNWSNRSTCGGWTMVMKASSGSDCLNRVQSSRWRSTSTIGDATTRSNTCAKGSAYSRSTFTDVMIGSTRAGHYRKNVAFRFPGNPSASMYAIVNSCTRKTDGKLIVPGYGNPSQTQFRMSLRSMDWRGGQSSSDGPYHYHDTCFRAHQSNGYHGIYKWGFFGRDSTCCGNTIVGCRSPGGHGGNVIGHGGDCGGDCPRNYGSDGSMYTRCITAWGFGAGYGGVGSTRDRETVNGHWWGHGNDQLQTFETGLFVRDATDLAPP